MAKHIVVCVYDEGTQCYGPLATFVAVGIASRSFADEVNNKREGNVLRAHPIDFSLWQLAVYDDVTGTFEPAKKKLVDAVTLVVDDV